jgi:hypothetical protein
VNKPKPKMVHVEGTIARVEHPCGCMHAVDFAAVDRWSTPAEVARTVATWNKRPAGRLARCPQHG